MPHDAQPCRTDSRIDSEVFLVFAPDPDSTSIVCVVSSERRGLPAPRFVGGTLGVELVFNQLDHPSRLVGRPGVVKTRGDALRFYLEVKVRIHWPRDPGYHCIESEAFNG
jgi:hypothetical protein